MKKKDGNEGGDHEGTKYLYKPGDIPELRTSRLRLSHDSAARQNSAAANNQDSHEYPYQTGAPKDPNIYSRINFVISPFQFIQKSSCHVIRDVTQPHYSRCQSHPTKTLKKKLDSGRLQGKLSKVTHLNVGLNVGLAIEQGGLPEQQ